MPSRSQPDVPAPYEHAPGAHEGLDRHDLATDDAPTYYAPPPDPRTRRGGRFRWTRSLRWRLTLMLSGLLALLLILLGLVLNAVIGRVLYTDELDRFQSETQALIASDQRYFDAAVSGHTSLNCAGAAPYQQAFADTIARAFHTQHPNLAIYLLDRSGDVLAPLDSNAAGTTAPDLLTGQLNALRRQIARTGVSSATGSISSVPYVTTDSSGRRLGVVLVAERYHTASPCVNRNNSALGVVEFVTTFPRTQAVLGALHLILALSLLSVLAVGVLTGGALLSRALGPLTRMTQTARRIASGDLSQRVRLPHSGDEIGQLANTFDEMVARIESAFAAQQASEDRMRQFIADASHELRTPLTSIRGYTDVLLRGAKDDPETATQVLLATRSEAERMSRLVNDLLTLARLDVGRPLDLQPVDVIALTGEAVDQARILAGEREVALHTDGGGRLMLMADSDRLKQVLLALLDNALKYGRQTPDGWVRVDVRRTDQNAVITIADNGEGIAPEDLPRIFDRFYRAQRAARGRQVREASLHQSAVTLRDSGGAHDDTPRRAKNEGSGLGLAIAQSIMRAHGGTLSVQSQVGRGTQFTLALPYSSPPRSS